MFPKVKTETTINSAFFMVIVFTKLSLSDNLHYAFLNQNPLWRLASKIKIAAATETFMLSISPCMGMMMF